MLYDVLFEWSLRNIVKLTCVPCSDSPSLTPPPGRNSLPSPGADTTSSSVPPGGGSLYGWEEEAEQEAGHQQHHQGLVHLHLQELREVEMFTH